MHNLLKESVMTLAPITNCRSLIVSLLHLALSLLQRICGILGGRRDIERGCGDGGSVQVLLGPMVIHYFHRLDTKRHFTLTRSSIVY